MNVIAAELGDIIQRVIVNSQMDDAGDVAVFAFAGRDDLLKLMRANQF